MTVGSSDPDCVSSDCNCHAHHGCEARLCFGNPAVQKARARDQDVLPWLESLFADVRYALRSLRKRPGFAVVAILSLGLAIGANTAIFRLIDAMMLRSPPVERPQELVRVTTPTRSGSLGEGGDNFTNPIWEALRDRQDIFSGFFATADERFDLAGGGESRPVEGAWVSGGYFSTLGVRPAAGRLVAQADDFRGCLPVVVVSHGFWQSAFGGAPTSWGGRWWWALACCCAPSATSPFSIPASNPRVWSSPPSTWGTRAFRRRSFPA